MKKAVMYIMLVFCLLLPFVAPGSAEADPLTDLLTKLDMTVGLAYTKHGLDDSFGIKLAEEGPGEWTEMMEIRAEATGYLAPIFTDKESHKMLGLVGTINLPDASEWVASLLKLDYKWSFPIRPDIGPGLYVEIDGFNFKNIKDHLVPGIYAKAVDIPLADIEKYMSTIYEFTFGRIFK